MQLAGYTYLIEELGLSLPSLGLELAIGQSDKEEIRDYGFSKIKLIPKTKKVGTTVCEHIETAIKYQGVRLAYLEPILKAIDEAELTSYIKEKPTSAIRRCIWYLYEWLLDKRLDIEDATANYTTLLRDEYYFTLKDGVKDSRTRVVNNMLGNKDFCPMIRKTPEIKEFSGKDLMQIAQSKLLSIHSSVNPELLGRSVQYLYTKETKSSIEIEKENTPNDKMRRFFRVIKTGGAINLSKKRLLDIQNEIVRSDKKDTDYRQEEIYVGETRMTWHDGIEENIHYIGPKYTEVPRLMQGLLNMHKTILLDNTLPPMMHAALLSFGFVYIHPFSDGNGRIHRYLIHDVLKLRSTTEQDFIIPVSASILAKQKEYDSVLETISKPLMAIIDYDVDKTDHSITINNDVLHLYKYPDYTPHALFLYKMMEVSISEDLIHEAIYIVKYDAIKKAIEEKFDIPNKELNLFIQLAIQNSGKIGNKKRAKFKKWIDESQLIQLEAIISSLLEEINHKSLD